jgi:hypothetical protein
MEGLASLAEERGDHQRANELLDAAAAHFLASEATLFLERVLARKELLGA